MNNLKNPNYLEKCVEAIHSCNCMICTNALEKQRKLLYKLGFVCLFF